MQGIGTSVACLFVVAGAASATPVEVIYTKITGHPTAVVPGAVDLFGNPETIEFRDLRDIALSPDGTQWMLNATTMNGAVTQSNRDSIILKGSGTSGTMFLQEGQPAPFGNTTDWISFIPSGFGKFNASNDIAVGIRTRTVQDGTTSSSSPSDGQRVLKWTSGGGFTAGPKQGQTYAGTGNVIGNSFSSYHLLNNGTIGFADTTVNGSSTINYLAYFDGSANTIFKTKNSSTVLDLDGTMTVTWGGFTSLNPTEFFTTPDGAHWFAKGTIQGAPTTSDAVWAYDGRVRLREGSAIPGSSPAIIVGDIFQYFAAGSHWIARGRDNSSTAASAPDFVVVDGVVVARTGDPIITGSSEHWGDTFGAVSVNANGDWVIAGNTDNANASTNEVLVFNGQSVLVREGDMVDLNRNGVADDDAFIGRASGTAFDPNDAHLSIGRSVYFVGYLRNAAGTDLGISPTAFLGPQAFMRTQAPSTCAADYNSSGGLDVQDIFDFLAAWFGGAPQADFNHAGGLNVQDIFDFLAAWFAGC